MDVIKLTAHEISKKLHAREISSVEVTKAFMERTTEVEGVVKAYITVFDELAPEMAKKADERLSRGENVTPLTGIPVALKDLICFKGYPTTCASKILQNFKPPYNATVVERLLNAGMVFTGKTNMDEFAMGSSTENSGFFNTHNPWDVERVPGGSSGGSAAVIAALEAPVSLGSDTGGSIRQPAAFCGVSGLKPTYGLVSRYGLVAFASSLDQIGPLGKDVLDIAMLLSVIAGHDPKDSTSVKTQKIDYVKEAQNKDIRKIKIGLPVEFFSEGLDDGIRKTLDEAKKVLKTLGAEFVEVSLPALKYSLAAYYIIAPSEASSNLARFDGCRYGYRAPDDSDVTVMSGKTRREGFGDEVLRRIMIGTYALSSGYYDAYYLKAQKVRTIIKRDFDEAFKKCDVLFSPATPTTAFKIGEKKDDPLSMYLSDIYTVSVNLAALPALVVPCGFSDNLPVGMQLIGKAFDETTLLRVGAAFQAVIDCHKKFPQL